MRKPYKDRYQKNRSNAVARQEIAADLMGIQTQADQEAEDADYAYLMRELQQEYDDWLMDELWAMDMEEAFDRF